MSIGNTFYQHKDIHKKTWRHPDGRVSNEIDYVCIAKRWRSSLLDVKVHRGADVGSDHHLLIAKFRLRLKRLPPTPQRARPFDVMKLKQPTVATQFQLELRNRFQAPADCEEAEDQWTQFRTTLTKSAEAVVGR
uniref:Uncharacterized protein n=1 Tax=Plectus sambesii TaxID=2011161 RepID=A0A914WUP2_9BILA